MDDLWDGPMPASCLPCFSRREGHRHTIQWLSRGCAGSLNSDHRDPDLWITLALTHAMSGLADSGIENVRLDGAPFEPNPRDGWNSIAYLRCQAALRTGMPDASQRAALALAEIEAVMGTW